MYNSMMIRAKHKDIPANVQSSLVEILDMMGFSQFDSIIRLEVISAYLALVFIEDFSPSASHRLRSYRTSVTIFGGT